MSRITDTYLSDRVDRSYQDPIPQTRIPVESSVLYFLVSEFPFPDSSEVARIGYNVFKEALRLTGLQV